jgi:hypothetical protein
LAGCGQFNPDSAIPADPMREEQTFLSERSLSLRLIRLRRKWVNALRKFTGSDCSKSSNGSNLLGLVVERGDN